MTITPNEHYLRKKFNLKPKEHILEEILNYFSKAQYEPDYQMNINSIDKRLYFKNKYFKSTISASRLSKPFNIDERGILINPNSAFHGFAVHKSTIIGEDDILITAYISSCNAIYCAKLYQINEKYYIYMYDSITSESKGFELTALSSLNRDISDYNVFLTIANNELDRHLEEFAKANRKRAKYLPQSAKKYVI